MRHDFLEATKNMRALLSVSNKSGLVDFALGLIEQNVEILSTGGTSQALAAAGLPVTKVSEITKFPEMMDGRVKTLHPAIHGGILARRDRQDDLAAIEGHGIQTIDIVVVNLYPFSQAATSQGTTFDNLIEQIDIGGPAMVRSAAKNFKDVLVVVDPADYGEVLKALSHSNGPAVDFRFSLARKAFAHTASYDGTIDAALSAIQVNDGKFIHKPLVLDGFTPDQLMLSVRKIQDLRYGENPHQTAALYADPNGWGFGSAEVVQGKGLSFTNLLDLDAAARLVYEFSTPAAVVIKHTNPCGVATAQTLAEAYVNAREVDSLSAFGGIVGLNRQLDAKTAAAITSTFIEAVVAPDVSEEARVIMSSKKNLRLVLADCQPLINGESSEVRSILGAFLVQKRDCVIEAATEWLDRAKVAPDTELRVVTQRVPSESEWLALRLAWRVCAHVKSNTVIFAREDRVVAVGAGQTSRVDAVNVATLKAGGGLSGTVAASDAFFPFRDGLDAIAKAGSTAVVQPGGSKRDEEVIAAADEHNMAMVFTGRRHFRH
jgi:phosphoribosylaminoimidazolecarboxamide formyltransferase/IMP cyclohydrolase